ncbi:MAG: DUF427 domain-containing protein [Pseudobacteriovorax sp.]|nr:DUF427 domain-containing protein [Pseudobacteriovorax sp.]
MSFYRSTPQRTPLTRSDQESVWDYPRPPRMEELSCHIEMYLGDELVIESFCAIRFCETASPPTYYLPVDSLINEQVRLEGSVKSSTFCEWKGRALYHDLVFVKTAHRIEAAAWSYPTPPEPYWAAKDWLGFYPNRFDLILLDKKEVSGQSGNFYGGWITSDIVGPFKGEPGTEGW